MNIVSSLLLLATASVAIMAQESNVKTVNIEDVENFYYNKGLQEGFHKGYIKGWQEHSKFALKNLRLYKKQILSYENGKYLVKDGKITAPMVFQKRTPDGSLELKIGGCQIEKPLSPAQIVSLPVLHESDFVQKKRHDFIEDVSNSVDISQRDQLLFHTREINIDKGTDFYYLYIPNSQTIRNALDKEGYTYSINKDRKKLKVVFTSKEDRDKFKKRVGL